MPIAFAQAVNESWRDAVVSAYPDVRANLVPASVLARMVVLQARLVRARRERTGE